MNISHNESISNRASLFAAQETNQSKYLEPDYFLPSSSSESYYSRKYSGIHNLNFKSKFSKVARILSASLLSAMMLTVTLDAKAHPSVESNTSFSLGKDSGEISTNIPIPPIMPQSPPVTPIASAMIPPVPPAPPISPVAPAMPDFVSDTSSGGKSENRSALFESIRNFGKNVLGRSRKSQSLK
ncbi:hypothetical protein [Rickettsia tamurae]|uniref:hypothetical protein n=1 Tax=Rickettsia tamurae TaxID=334545 RepID=UPI00050A1962|nr:hypothetical protein [Rickettsia tamurae]